jgi:DNA-binding IclR family transcriptional regulator
MGRDGRSVVEKISIIIQRFLDERATSLTFNDILAGASLSRGTTHRLLADMTGERLLTQDAAGEEYRLGPVLLSAGALAQQASGVAERALPRMETLRDQFQETIVLAELRRDSVVPIRRIDGLHEMRMNQEIGRPQPAFAGATGKVLLAHVDPEELTTYLANVHLEQFTDSTVSSVEALRIAVERIRRVGVAVSRGERVSEAVAMSAPLFDARDHLVGALTISGVASRWNRDRMFLAGQAVKQAAEAISHELGHHAPPNATAAAQLQDPHSSVYRLFSEMCDETWQPNLAETSSVGR